MKYFKFTFSIFLTLILFVPPLEAQTSFEEELKAMKVQFEAMQEKLSKLEETVANQQSQLTLQQESKQAYETRIKDLEEQLANRENVVVSSPSAPAGSAAKWIPDIGVVADTVATINSAKTDTEGSDRLSVRELELILGSAVDPFSRMDATISFSDTEEPSLEEAYLTRFSLPLDSTARIGKFKPRVGKALAIHRDSLDTVDEPLVIQNYFGIEGLSKSGVDFSKNLNLPIPLTQQLTFGILEGGNGEEGTAFGETRRRPTLYGHLKNYFDVTDTTGLELGLSHMTGSRDEDSSFEVRVWGLDGTLTQQLSATQRLKLQGEAFRLNRKESLIEVDDGLGETTFADSDDDFWGTYGLADFRFHSQWSTGFRYDYVEPVDSSEGDEAYSGYLTFYQSEFARWRAQLTHKDAAVGEDDNAVYLQGTFSIGEHKHKLQ